MTTATREALERVAHILHEAGWDQPLGPGREVPGQNVEGIRHAYETLLRSDHSAILRLVLQDKLGLREAGASLGLPETEAAALFAEALTKLRDFVETYEGARQEPGGEGQVAGSSRSPQET